MLADRDQQTTDTFLVRLEEVFRSTDSHRVVEEACGLLGVHLAADQVYYTEVIAPGSELRRARGNPGRGLQNAEARHSFGAFANALALLAPGPLLHIPGVERDPCVPGSVLLSSRALKARGVIAGRVTRGGRLVAVLVVTFREPRRCASADVALVNEAADRAWDSLQRAAWSGSMSTPIRYERWTGGKRAPRSWAGTSWDRSTWNSTSATAKITCGASSRRCTCSSAC